MDARPHGRQHEARRLLAAGRPREAHEACLRVLQADPDNADALFVCGLIATGNGRWQQGAAIFERVVRVAPRNAEYRAQLGKAWIQLNRHAEALREADIAAGLAPEDALVLDTIGVIFSRAGEHDRALPLFRAATTRDPANASFQFNLASALKFCGDFGAAEAAYERTLVLDPGHHQAHAALSQLRTQTPEHNHVARLMAQLERPLPDADAELHLCHALAKEYEDLGDYRGSLALLQRGKQRKRAARSWRIEDDVALFEAARLTLDTTPRSDGNAGHDSDEPIFVVGMPRTGTTLVERILSAHREVFAAGELQNFGLVTKRATATPSRHVLDPETLRAAALLDAAALGRAYIDSTRPRTGHTAHFIDKLPLNFFYIGLIHRALPRARIVCLRRHPMDTCLSNYRQLFSTHHGHYGYALDLQDCARYYLQFDALMRHWDAVLPGRIHTVCYENLIDDPEREAAALLAYCGLDWDPRCLDLQANSAPVATASAVQVRRPLYRGALQRWTRYGDALHGLLAVLQQGGVMEGEEWCARPPPSRHAAGN